MCVYGISEAYGIPDAGSFREKYFLRNTSAGSFREKCIRVAAAVGEPHQGEAGARAHARPGAVTVPAGYGVSGRE
jgi:hypothetical protein